MASGWLHDGNAMIGDVTAEISGGNDAVAQVVLLERFLQPDGYGFKVASSEPAVGGVTFRENEEVFLLSGEDVVVCAEESADVGHAIFLRGHGAAIAQG